MKKVGICLIARDSEVMLKNTLSLLDADCGKLTEKYQFFLSMYENDSMDDTVDIMSEYPLKNIKSVVTSELTNNEKFGSVVSKERIELMARCRTRCVDALYEQVGGDLDLILWLDVDYTWTNDAIEKLLDAVDEDGANIADVASAYSLHADIQRPHMELYDKWATRYQKDHSWWHCSPHTFMPEAVPVYSTFNGLCAYKAGPFNEGLRFSAESESLPKLDVEHVSICEGFQKAGLGRVMLMKDLFSLHFADPNNLDPWMAQPNPWFER